MSSSNQWAMWGLQLLGTSTFCGTLVWEDPSLPSPGGTQQLDTWETIQS